MSTQERWDVVIKVLDGPLAGLGEQTLRGPVVRIGVSPGPGGLQLTGYRGLDARHAVITAYDGGTVTIGPVGSNQVRLGPHANVNWKEIDPVSQPQYLNQGGAIHLGPVGRGATLEFVKAQRLGQWVKGQLASEADSAASAQIKQQGGMPGAMPGGGIPGGYNAKKSRSIVTSTAPVWFLGCMFLMAGMAITTVLIVGFVWQNRQITKLGPTTEGEYFQDFAVVDKDKLQDSGLLEGLQGPFSAFVMKYNAEAANEPSLDAPENWDQDFYDRVVASVMQHVTYKKTFRRFEEITDDYALVTQIMQEEGLPEVFAGIPYRESTYKPDLQSVVCAKGYWQFMPEVAHRVGQEGLDFKLSNCHWNDGDGTWSPTEITPPRSVAKKGIYMSAAGKCRIKTCDVDDRTKLEPSTRAAAYTLKEAWNDETLKGSGALVQIVIASHNAGYDDARFQVAKKSNMLPAYVAWAKGKKVLETSKFYGTNISCGEPEKSPDNLTNSAPPAYCGDSPLHSETQHYVYPIVARHILAVCYYGKNHSDIKAFKGWAKYSDSDGYCSKFNIPAPGEIK